MRVRSAILVSVADSCRVSMSNVQTRTRETETQMPVRLQVIVLMSLQRRRNPCNLTGDQTKKGVIGVHQ